MARAAAAAARLLPLFLLRRRPPPPLRRCRLLNPSRKTLSTRAESLASRHSVVLPSDERSPSPSRLPRRPVTEDYGGGGGSPETIAAIVTSLGGGPAAVGIVRLSGPDAVAVVGRVFRRRGGREATSLSTGSRWTRRGMPSTR